MPVPSRWSDIRIQGGLSYIPGEGPFWQGTEARPTGWWHPKAVLAADFLNLRCMRGSTEIALASALATTRSSAHLLANAAGVYQSFAANALAASAGVGAYIGGQITNMAYPSADLSDPRWVKTGLSVSAKSVAVLGASANAALTEDGSTGSHGATMGSAPRPISTAGLHTAFFGLEAGTRRFVQCVAGGGLTSCFITIDTQTWTVTETAGAQYVAHRLLGPYAGGARILEMTVNNAGAYAVALAINGSGTGTPGIAAPSYAGNGSTIICWGIGATPGRFFGPCIPTTAGTATRYASDVKAIASGGEPFAGFAVNALGAAMSMLAAINLSRLGDGVVRHVAELSDGTSGNRLRLFIDTDDKAAAQVVSGGTVLATAKLGSALVAGRGVLAANFDPANGLYLVRKSGLQDAAANFGAVPAGLNLLKLGSGQGGLYLNDIVEQVQVCRALTQAEARGWVQAA